MHEIRRSMLRIGRVESGGESIKLVGILVTSSSSSSTSGREEEEEMEMDMEGNESGSESSRVDDDSHRRRRMTDDDTHGNEKYSEQIAVCCAADGILYVARIAIEIVHRKRDTTRVGRTYMAYWYSTRCTISCWTTIVTMDARQRRLRL